MRKEQLYLPLGIAGAIIILLIGILVFCLGKSVENSDLPDNTSTESMQDDGSEVIPDSETSDKTATETATEIATETATDTTAETTTQENTTNSESASTQGTTTRPDASTTSSEKESSSQSGSSTNTNTSTSTSTNIGTTTEPSTEEVAYLAGYSGMRDISTMELVQDMGIGINLGNTFESYGDWIEQWGAGGYPSGTVEAYETAWGSPVITKKIIQGYASEGFDTIRIPVHWMNLMSEDYTLSTEYIQAVRKVVEWALDADMYVIINIHHDEDGFFANFATDKENCMKAYARVWEQVAAAFKDYDDHLIFEALNEEGGWDSIWNRWSGSTTGKAEAYSILNEINQTFVDTVRASGGNNKVRHLMISGYYTDIELTSDALFKMPKDLANRCAVTVHYYTPSDFAILEEDADWGTCRFTWGTNADITELNRLMDLLKTNFVDKNIPVIIGEYGCPKNNKEAASVRLYLTSVCEAALKRDMCPIMWDITDLHYNRTTCKMVDQELKEQLNRIAAKY